MTGDRPSVYAVLPPEVMAPDGGYREDTHRRWCADHNVSLLAFHAEAERRRLAALRARRP